MARNGDWPIDCTRQADMGTCYAPMVSIRRLWARVVVMCSSVCLDVEQMFAVCKILQENRQCWGQQFKKKKDK